MARPVLRWRWHGALRMGELTLHTHRNDFYLSVFLDNITNIQPGALLSPSRRQRTESKTICRETSNWTRRTSKPSIRSIRSCDLTTLPRHSDGTFTKILTARNSGNYVLARCISRPPRGTLLDARHVDVQGLCTDAYPLQKDSIVVREYHSSSAFVAVQLCVGLG